MTTGNGAGPRRPVPMTKELSGVTAPLIVPAVTAAEFRKRRAQLAASQSQMARVLKVHTMTISKWERGVHDIPEPVALLLQRLKPADIKRLGKRKD